MAQFQLCISRPVFEINTLGTLENIAQGLTNMFNSSYPIPNWQVGVASRWEPVLLVRV